MLLNSLNNVSYTTSSMSVDECPKCNESLFASVDEKMVYCIAEEYFFFFPASAWMHYSEVRELEQ